MNMSSPVMETKDEIPPDQLPAPEKLTGIGNVHMQITATPEAQAWFNQGLNLLHDFWDYESARAFEHSIRTDPQCAARKLPAPSSLGKPRSGGYLFQ